MINMPRKIKIVFCMYWIITGGVETCLMRIIQNLIRTNKYEFKIVTRKKTIDQYFFDFFKENNIEIYCIEKTKKFSPKLKTIFKNSDIIIDYFNFNFLYNLESIKKPKIGVYHSSINCFNKEFKTRKDLLFKTYDKLICLTKSFKNDVVEQFPQYKEKIVQLYNPIDIHNIQNLAKEGDYPKDEKYFVFLARLHKDKDHDCVIEAFRLFNERVSNGKMYFIGAGDKELEYKNKVKALGLDQKIIFTGVKSNPYGYLKHSTANILSSPNEGFSNVLIEAAALNVLNIASNCKSSVSEVLLDGEGGILFPIGDSKKLCEIMIDVWNEKIDKHFYIENAAKQLSRFDINQVVPEFEKIILNEIQQFENKKPSNFTQIIRNYLYKICKKI